MTAPVMIFGAHGGIGEALARRLAADGVPLFLTGSSGNTVGPLADALNARHAACDVFDPSSINDAVAAADTGAPERRLTQIGSSFSRSIRRHPSNIPV